MATHLRPPLQPWMVWLLVLCTFGIYLPFWLCATARNTTDLGIAKRSPALWFLGGVFSMAAPFLFMQLAKDYDNGPDDSGPVAGHTPRFRTLAPLVGLALPLLGIAIMIGGHIEAAPVAVTAIMLGLYMLYGLPVAIAQRYVNRRFALVEERRLRRRPYRFGPAHYVTLTLSVALVAFAFAAPYLYGPAVDRGKELVVDTFHEDPSGRFGIYPKTSGWRVATSGTYSDGTAIAEFGYGPQQGSMVIFTLDPQQSIGDHVSWRIDTFHDEQPDTRCTERRDFFKDALRLRATVECIDALGADQGVLIISVLEVEEGATEVLGTMQVDASLGTHTVADARQQLASMLEAVQIP